MGKNFGGMMGGGMPPAMPAAPRMAKPRGSRGLGQVNRPLMLNAGSGGGMSVPKRPQQPRKMSFGRGGTR